MGTVKDPDQVRAPDAEYVRQRWIRTSTVDWVKQCDAIMLEFGAVTGSTVYPERHRARHRARKLMRLMDELRIHERWELREHTDRRPGGWVWTVEYIRRDHG